MIQPNCRIQFTKSDLDFIVSVLDQDGSSTEHIYYLLSDPDSSDVILDDKRILRAVLEDPACLKISTHLYFYILVRHVLKDAGIADNNLTEYIAEVLGEFGKAEKTTNTMDYMGLSSTYLVDMLKVLENADDKMRFFIQLFIGNYSLFLAGIFPDRIRRRWRYHAAPDITYYERLGRSNYGRASEHRLARKYGLSSILSPLSESFHNIRLALNDLSHRLVFLNSSS